VGSADFNRGLAELVDPKLPGWVCDFRPDAGRPRLLVDLGPNPCDLTDLAKLSSGLVPGMVKLTLCPGFTFWMSDS